MNEQYLMGMEEKAQNLGHLPQLVLVPPLPPPPCTGPLCFQDLTNSARGRSEADLDRYSILMNNNS